ncbi:glycosyltransferase [candidate division KSB1 bacterium]|nr:glycosyltransferase [candidate division KSB1 bacterium]
MNHNRFIHVIGSGDLGGAELYAHQLACNQMRLYPDCHPVVVYQKSKGPLLKHYPRLEKIQAPCRFSLQSAAQFIRLFKHADRILFHGFYPQLLFLALISNRNTFYFVHGARVLSKPASTVIKKTFTHKHRPRFSGVIRRLKKKWLEFALRHCRQVFAPSDCYREFATSIYKIPEKKIQTCALGIDTNRFNRDCFSRPIPHKRVIGCIASFRPIKQLDKLVLAFANLSRQHKATQLYLIGNGEEKPRIKALIGKLGLDDKVSLLDATPQIEHYINLFDVFVLPSKFESFSLVLLEAMYLKCPVIVFSDSGGAAELVEKTQGGLVAKDQNDLVKKIAYLLQNQDIRERVGQQGYLAVRSNFQIEHSTRNLHSLTRA